MNNWFNSTDTCKRLKIRSCELIHRRESGVLVFKKVGNAYFYQLSEKKTIRLKMTAALKEYCSQHYKFEDMFHCGETWQNTQCPNLPIEPQSWEAYKKLAQEILDPITNHFGPVQLTFGFCGQQLRSLIRKNPSPRIAPTLDQHAAYERNTKGKPICPRLGAAIDLRVNNTSSQAVAIWAASYLPFDRLYYYGDDKPIHISIGPGNSSQIVWLNTIHNRRIPKRLTLNALITLQKK